ncbi:MAG: hypothetical protein H7141_12350 [Burkholderiales bacterium]|nr:hypothetical protein [Bacteroidia bacterium]
MKNILPIILMLSLLNIVGCKKKSTNETSPDNSSTQGSVSTVTVSFNTQISIQEYYGMPQNNSFGSYAWAWANSNAQLGTGDSIGVFGGSSYWQKFNGSGSISNTENDSTTANIKFHQQYNWVVSANHIPSTQYLTLNTSPYMNIGYLQNINSITKSGLTISHPNLICTHVDYYISDSPNFSVSANFFTIGLTDNITLGGSTYHFIKKTVNGNSTGVYFSSSDLNTFSNSSSGGTIFIRAYNIETNNPSAAIYYTYKNATNLVKKFLPITN